MAVVFVIVPIGIFIAVGTKQVTGVNVNLRFDVERIWALAFLKATVAALEEPNGIVAAPTGQFATAE